MPLVPAGSGHPAILQLRSSSEAVSGWSPAGPLRTQPGWLAATAAVTALRALFLLLLLFGAMKFSSSRGGALAEDDLGWSAPSVGAAAPVTAATETPAVTAGTPAVAAVAAVAGDAAGMCGRYLPLAPSQRTLPEGLPTALSQGLQVLLGYQDVVTARALTPSAAVQRNTGTIMQLKAENEAAGDSASGLTLRYTNGAGWEYYNTKHSSGAGGQMIQEPQLRPQIPQAGRGPSVPFLSMRYETGQSRTGNAAERTETDVRVVKGALTAPAEGFTAKPLATDITDENAVTPATAAAAPPTSAFHPRPLESNARELTPVGNAPGQQHKYLHHQHHDRSHRHADLLRCGRNDPRLDVDGDVDGDDNGSGRNANPSVLDTVHEPPGHWVRQQKRGQAVPSTVAAMADAAFSQDQKQQRRQPFHRDVAAQFVKDPDRQIQHHAQRHRHASGQFLKQSQPELQSQLQLRIAPCSDIVAWAVEAALLPLDRPLPPRFTAPYEHCIQPGGELKELAAAVADGGEMSANVKVVDNGTFDSFVTGGKRHATSATTNQLDSNSVPADPVVPCTEPEQPLLPLSALAVAVATLRADSRNASFLAAAVGQAGASWTGSKTSTWEADTDTELDAMKAGMEAERDSPQLPSRGSHTRSLLQFFVQGALPVARTSIDIPNDFKIVGLLGLALFQMQDTAGRNRSANTALATTFQGAGFPFGVSFSLTNDFGGSTQHSYRFGTATDTRGAASDGLQTGRAVSTVPFGDVNVVTNILSAALAQRKIVQLKPPPPSPLSSSWDEQSEGKHRPLRIREAEHPQGEVSQEQHQPQGVHGTNTTGADTAAGETAREGDSSGKIPGGSGGGGGSRSNHDGHNHRKSDINVDIDVDALLAEYDYWNGYLYPFYNIEYDMTYTDYDSHSGGGSGDIPADRLPDAPRNSGGANGSSSAGGSTGEADSGNRSGGDGDGAGQANVPRDRYRTQDSKFNNNNNGSSPYTAYLYDPFDVLMATTLEYGRAGQYDYFYAEFYRFLSNYYSGPQIVPTTALARTRGTSAAVRDNQATTSGSSKNAATGLNVAATVQSISAAIRGVSQSLRQQDIIGNDTFTGAPEEPARQSGVVASGLSFGRGYFFQAPSEAYLAAGTTANVARGGGKTAGAGGWSVGFAAGNKYSGSRSNIFAQSGSQNLAFDVAG